MDIPVPQSCFFHSRSNNLASWAIRYDGEALFEIPRHYYNPEGREIVILAAGIPLENDVAQILVFLGIWNILNYFLDDIVSV